LGSERVLAKRPTASSESYVPGVRPETGKFLSTSDDDVIPHGARLDHVENLAGRGRDDLDIFGAPRALQPAARLDD